MEVSTIYSEMNYYSHNGALLSKENSEDLSASIREGEEEAFGQLFDQYQQFIARFIYGMVGDHEITQELTQETFMGAYRNRQSLRGEAKLGTWLCGIAKNVVSNFFRSRRRHENYIKTEIDESVIESKSPLISPDKQLLNEELNQVIQKALLQLDEDRRVVFVLKIFQQLSYQEISEITGLSLPKLKTDLHRAKVDVRRLIHPYLEAKK